MYLLIVEVSQKQKYIFGSLKLKDNVRNSSNIAQAVSPEYLNDIVRMIKKAEGSEYYGETSDFIKNNMVYSGGGHTVMQFETEEEAVDFARVLTLKARRDFVGMELFAKVMEYDETKTPAENMEELSKQLEIKKSLRKSAFRGESTASAPNKNDFVKKCFASSSKSTVNGSEPEAGEYKGLKITNDIGELAGGDDNSFVAVVHIDGNSMGKRVNDVRKRASDDWDKFRSDIKNFSDGIDEDFKETFREMLDVVADNINAGRLKNVGKKGCLPVRRLILAGDDVCFVCNGKIGLECANVFLEKLSQKKNKQDHKNYYAAAGVCIVHSKFPFYRAYEIAEGLCSSAKRVLAEYKNEIEKEMPKEYDTKEYSAIDWHIEFGEMESTVDAIKDSFIAKDRTHMLLRPYVMGETNVPATEKTDTIFCYRYFRKTVMKLFKNPEKTVMEARGKLKELRKAIREGEESAKYFTEINNMQKILVEPIREIFGGINKEAKSTKELAGPNGIYFKDEARENKRCVVYDAIECADLFEGLEEV